MEVRVPGYYALATRLWDITKQDVSADLETNNENIIVDKEMDKRN